MRRSSYTPLPPEPLIVVEEAAGSEEEDAEREDEMGEAAGISSFDYPDDDDEDPNVDPALLCPWRDPRDLRKRSLPTPSCTSGITASQVRRLSERSAATARESAFLATLTSAPAPGRRHSVTISRVPPSIFPTFRGRRESIAAFPNRRDSAAASFSLHLDIMDDIAEIKGARKAKMKIYKTDSKEQVCELQDGNGSPVRFQSPAQSPMSGTLRAPHNEGRRHSDSAGLASLMPPIVPPRRKASEQLTAGIVCTNNDLVTLLSLTSSAQEINIPPPPPQFKTDAPLKSTEQKRPKLKNARSNSFDIGMLKDTSPLQQKKVSPASWFAKRHQPMSKKEEMSSKPIETPSVTFTGPEESVKSTRSQSCVGNLPVVIPDKKEKASKVVWDKPSGSVVDAELLGSAIEVYLRRGESANTSLSPSAPPAAPTPSPASLVEPDPTSQNRNSTNTDPKGKDSTCETSSSICSTLKDLFVK